MWFYIQTLTLYFILTYWRLTGRPKPTISRVAIVTKLFWCYEIWDILKQNLSIALCLWGPTITKFSCCPAGIRCIFFSLSCLHKLINMRWKFREIAFISGRGQLNQKLLVWKIKVKESDRVNYELKLSRFNSLYIHSKERRKYFVSIFNRNGWRKRGISQRNRVLNL